MTDKAARDARLGELADQLREAAFNYKQTHNGPLSAAHLASQEFEAALAALLAAAKETT